MSENIYRQLQQRLDFYSIKRDRVPCASGKLCRTGDVNGSKARINIG
jgi:hypothetical protein